jgi:hypothetical protein
MKDIFNIDFEHNNFGHVILVVQDLGGNGEGSQKFVEA